MIISKYTKAAKTKHIMPARLKNYQYKKVLQLARKQYFKMWGVTRADFKFEKNNFLSSRNKYSTRDDKPVIST